TVRYGIAETLFKLDNSMNIINNIAESYENIDDFTWKIKIREGITFQNGKIVTPEKVIDSLKRVCELNKRADDTLKIKDMKIEGWNIIITTSYPNPTLINDLCDPFASIIDVEGTEDFDNMPVGTGPFKMTEFNPIKSSNLERYNNYWQGEPKLKEIKIIHVSDADTLTMALQTGEIDVAQGIPYSSLKMFENDPLYKISSVDTSRVILMYYNFNNILLQDESVRKAISMSIDKEKYASVLLENSASAAYGPFPESMSVMGSSNDEKYDIYEAENILKEAGYADTDNDGILEKDGHKLKFKLITYSTRAELPLIAQALQSDLKEIGIDISVEVSDNIMDVLQNGQFDLAIYSNVTAATGDTYAYLNNLIKAGGSSNYGSYVNSRAEMLLEDMESEFNIDKRNELSSMIVREILDDYGFDFIAHLKMSFVMKNNVVNFDIHATDYYQFNWETDVE
ncbi:MAG: ABC transporter substrate-binding protein, partial [Clostridium sp.]